MLDEEDLISNRTAKWFYTLLILAGIVVYLSWGVLFNVWWDLGIYSVTVTLLGFGVVGYLLYATMEREEDEEEEKGKGKVLRR